MADFDFGFGGNNATGAEPPANNQPTTPPANDPVDVNTNQPSTTDINNPNNPPASTPPANGTEPPTNGNDDEIIAGSVYDIDGVKYKVDDKLNLVDDKGNIFKQANEVKDFLASFDSIEENDPSAVTIDSIREAFGIDITDDNNKPVEFENTPTGIKGYIDAVIEQARQEHFETALNTLYQKYPIITDVLNYYVSHNNSLEGFTESDPFESMQLDATNEAQCEEVIKQAFAAKGFNGDVNQYIAFLKTQGTLGSTAQAELANMQQLAQQKRENDARQAAAIEEQNRQEEIAYWQDVYNTVKSQEIAGYKIPDSFTRNVNGQKIAATPIDFFNYIYQVDDDGNSQYNYDMMNETPQSRRDDSLLRAYLKFTGGTYADLVNMAIHQEEVKRLRTKANQRNTHTVRVTKPQGNKSTPTNETFGY